MAKMAAGELDFDVSQLPCHLLPAFWYCVLALAKRP
jgi:hypothetical protein